MLLEEEEELKGIREFVLKRFDESSSSISLINWAQRVCVSFIQFIV